MFFFSFFGSFLWVLFFPDLFIECCVETMRMFCFTFVLTSPVSDSLSVIGVSKNEPIVIVCDKGCVCG